MNTIYYFTGTGNSQMLAESLLGMLPDSNTQEMTYQVPHTLCASSTITFVFPVYFWGVPNIVRNFIQALQIPLGTKCYAIAAPGNSSGAAFSIVHSLLMEKGLVLNGYVQIKMPENFLPMFAPPSQEKQAELFRLATQSLHSFAALINASGTMTAPRKMRAAVLYHNWNRKQFPQKDRKYQVSSSCTGCGTCESLCPAANIQMTDGKPVFLHHCEYCLACVQHCPAKAIQCGRLSANRSHYHNPYVNRLSL